MKVECYRCDKEWEHEGWGGIYDQNKNRICFQCHKKELDEYHQRQIEILDRHIRETTAFKELDDRLKKLEDLK